MTISRRRASGRKQARRFNAAAPCKAAIKGQFIPTKVLKQLSELGLPKDPRIYTDRLRELLRSA